ncbi:xanthine dehydrogenase accessory factor [Clostridium tetanomorphum]|uniref:selenium-dependent molybdenum cofactor biosynthesis protein YqeB n=1 Tax=Clostridium tetanomorphum TaxID=1553 RepID=UPI0004494E0E|nr:selenium-dependent molybdenum cofactor biosynthesis protein YqeB [Clostridium tetanomorphum]KAJ48805.1 selenium-dependent molybdenum hydroxylase system protein [Clostridium tetanomorphum DSM 665]KAJ52062.1 selenium-dependent molybdenum hydroxylase system protein [Clostridium tetanomorphum DSM 665]MBP1862982.1 xanthine dehydrogenase accessory factor [Clostridium tetanomorphum]NRS82811.1 xanthine dehydrogenase accessory factor [Clostridium tetanomorphum]SQC00068.1 selenium-dependent molybdenu
MFKELVVVRSGGDLGTAIAHKLFNCGFKVVVTDIQKPLVVRRTVSFAQAIFQGEITIENIKGVKINNFNDIESTLKNKCVPVIVDPYLNILKNHKVDVIIDATLRKKNVDMNKDLAQFTIGVGPGFYASKDVHIVIETKRGHNLGRVIYNGEAIKNTGVPGSILGYTNERVLRAPCSGKVRNFLNIGDYVKKGQIIGQIEVEDKEDNIFYKKQKESNKCFNFKSEIDGVLRGLIMEGTYIEKGVKIGDVDPRGIREYCYSISDKGRAIAGGVLEGILWWRNSLKDGDLYGN